jgi:hypothetical protein
MSLLASIRKPWNNKDDVLALEHHNNHVIASAAWQSRTVQVRST